MGITESLCCTPVTNTSLLINYNIKLKFKKRLIKSWSSSVHLYVLGKWRKEHRETHLLCKYLGLEVIYSTVTHYMSKLNELPEDLGNVVPSWGDTLPSRYSRRKTIGGKHRFWWTHHYISLPSNDNNNILLIFAYFVPDIDVLNIYI